MPGTARAEHLPNNFGGRLRALAQVARRRADERSLCPAIAERYVLPAQPDTISARADGKCFRDRLIYPTRMNLTVNDIGHDDRESLSTIRKIPGAVDGIDNPHRIVCRKSIKHGLVGEDRFLPNDCAARHKIGQPLGQPGLGLYIGDGDQFAPVFLIDLSVFESTKPWEDDLRRRRFHKFRHAIHVGEQSVHSVTTS